MSTQTLRIPDPLVDVFPLADLPRIAPWVAEEIEALGPARVREQLERMHCDPDAPQHMNVWVKAVTELRGPFWEALQVA